MFAEQVLSRNSGRARAPLVRALLLITLALRPPSAFAQQADAPAATFDSYFEPVDTVALSSDVLVGEIHSLAVAPDGRLLIVDRVTWDVLLFEKDGSFVRTLSAADCNPGFEMHPIQAVFNGDEIFLANSGVWGYRFHRDGTCKAAVDDAFRPATFLAADPRPDPTAEGGLRAGDLYLLRATPEEHFIRQHDHTGKPIREFTHHQDLPEYMRRTGTKYVMVQDDAVFLVRPNRTTTLQYSRDGAFEREFGYVPDDFREVTSDITFATGDIQAMMRAAGRMLAENSSVLRAGLLDDSTMVVQYNTPARAGRRGIYLFSYNLAGEPDIPPVALSRYLYHVGSGRLYSVDASAVSNEEANNPSLVVYARRQRD